MARTLASERSATAGANPSVAPAAAALTAVEPATVLTAAALPVAKPTRCFREQTARYNQKLLLGVRRARRAAKPTRTAFTFVASML
jgi:hypothetical protein